MTGAPVDAAPPPSPFAATVAAGVRTRKLTKTAVIAVNSATPKISRAAVMNRPSSVTACTSVAPPVSVADPPPDRVAGLVQRRIHVALREEERRRAEDHDPEPGDDQRPELVVVGEPLGIDEGMVEALDGSHEAQQPQEPEHPYAAGKRDQGDDVEEVLLDVHDAAWATGEAQPELQHEHTSQDQVEHVELRGVRREEVAGEPGQDEGDGEDRHDDLPAVLVLLGELVGGTEGGADSFVESTEGAHQPFSQPKPSLSRSRSNSS